EGTHRDLPFFPTRRSSDLEEERENIFKPFFQGKARRRGPLQGTGLGLAIVQECVAHLHGKIEVESSPEGSAFTLRFPLRSETYQDRKSTRLNSSHVKISYA